VKENDFKGIDSDSLTVLKVVFYLMMTSSQHEKHEKSDYKRRSYHSYIQIHLFFSLCSWNV